MTREEFIEEYCQRSGISWEELSKRREAIPCTCGEDLCKGWAMVSVEPPHCDRARGGPLFEDGPEFAGWEQRANVTKQVENTND